MQLNVSHAFLPKQNSVRAASVMDHFGIDFEQGAHTIAAGLELPIQSGQVILFTGASGSGKSSLMRSVAEQLSLSAVVIHLDELELGDQLLIDSIQWPVEAALQLLCSCGLGEAQLLLRTPRRTVGWPAVSLSPGAGPLPSARLDCRG